MTKRHQGVAARTLWVLLLTAMLLSQSVAVLAVDEECDTNSPVLTSPANDLCVPAIGGNFTIDAFDTEWSAGNFYEHSEYAGGGVQQARVRVSRKATGVNKSDLFLFFYVTGDAVQTGLDEIRIGLNPGTTPANSTLIKLHPSPINGTLPKETLTFNAGAGTWNTAGSGDAWMPPANVSVRSVPASASWFAEVKISLDKIPTNPITGASFRLYLELIADDNVTPISYQWPAEYVAGEHNFICANPARWQPMSFGTNCFPDLSIANGLYSCDAIYVLRNGAKSTEIAVGQQNEFHADVTNGGSAVANGVVVYMASLKTGISAGPVSMNYDFADPTITQFFNERFGPWLTPVDKLDTGTPKPPTPFNVNGGATETGARFNWKPTDEARFGTAADFIGTHKCTAAFVNFKDDPNFGNNISYCNTSIVACPTGQVCAMAFQMGQSFAFGHQGAEAVSRIVISGLNTTPDWFKRAELRIDGQGIERIGDHTYQLRVPQRGDVPVQLAINTPRVTGQNHTSLMPEVFAQSPPSTDKPPTGDNKGGSDIVKERDERLHKMYGNRPIILVEGLSQAFFETTPGQAGQG
ncbi:MAG: hypothetical protein WCD76_08815, partial [Pyrinomonadaceae bacterium]